MLKIGPFAMAGSDALLDWHTRHATTVKYFGVFTDDAPHGTAVVVARPQDVHGSVEVGVGDPAQAARWYYDTNIRRFVEENPKFVYWSSPNEPVFDWEKHMLWYAQFLYEYAKILHSVGRRAVIGEWSVGCPTLKAWRYYGKALSAVHEFGAIHSRHCYGPLTTDYSFRHELDELEFRKLGFYNTSTLLTEIAAEWLPEVGWNPWKIQYGSDIQVYFDGYIKPVELRIRQTPYVIGAHLFTSGTSNNPRWSDYDVAGYGLPQMMVNLSRELGPVPPMAAPTRRTMATNQDVINAFDAMFGKELYWLVIVVCGLAGLILKRKASYTGPDFGLKMVKAATLLKQVGL